MKRKQSSQSSSSSSSSFFSALTQQPNEKYIKTGNGGRQLNIVQSIREEAAAEKLKKKLSEETSRLEKVEEEVQSSVRACAERAWSDSVELMKDLTYNFGGDNEDSTSPSNELRWYTNLGNANPPFYMGHGQDDRAYRQCGVLADIDSCWERQGKIFRVTSLKSTGQVAEIDLKSSKPIESVTLTGPLKQVSKGGDKLGLVLVYEDRVVLLLYSQSARTIHNCGLWTETPKSATPFSVAATKCGRVFFGGNDGHIYELVCRKERYFFGKRKVFLVSRTKSWIPLLDGLKSIVSTPDPIVQLEVDESRSILYALRKRSSSIDMYSIFQEKSPSHFSYMRTLSNIYSLAYNATSLLLLSRECGPNYPDLVAFYGYSNIDAQKAWESIWDTYFKRFIVSIHSVPKQASVSFSLVAITSQGALLYFTSTGILASVVLPPLQGGPVSAFHVSGPCLHSDGTFLIPFTKEKPVKENFILCWSFLNMGGNLLNPFELYRMDSNEHVLGVHKSVSKPKLNVPQPPASVLSSKKTFKISHPLFSQYYDEAPRYFVETTEGLRVCGRRWPIDVLKRKILSEEPYLENDPFFRVVSPREVYSMCLYIHSSTVGAKGVSASDKILLTKAAAMIFERFTFGIEDSEKLKNLRVDGAFTFVSRIVQPVLDSAICSPSGKESAWSREKLEDTYVLLMNASNFLSKGRSICGDPKVLSGVKVLNIVCETLNFVSLMCRRNEVFTNTLKTAKVKAESLCVRDLILNKKVRTSVMAALVAVLRDTENAEALELMEEKCPFYFLSFKTSPAMKEIYGVRGVSSRRRAASALGEQQGLDESLEYYINTPGIDIDFVCTKYVNANRHAEALHLAIAKGNKLGQASDGAPASGKLQLRAKNHCYVIAIGILSNYSGPAKLRDELVKIALSFTGDKDWNEMVWSWCIKNNLKSILVECSPRPLLVRYLLTRGDSHDIVCKCYMEDGGQRDAFDFLYSSATSNGVSMDIDKRLDLLRNALGIATYTKVIDQANVAKAQGAFDVIALQVHVLERLEAKNVLGIKDSDLAKKVLPLGVLFSEYAMKYNMYDLMLRAMKIENARRKDVVEKIYIDALFVQGLEGYAMPDVLSLLGRQFYDKDDDSFFPVEFLLEQLFLRGFLNNDAVRRLHDCGVPYFRMFSYLRGKKHDNAAVLLANICARDLTEGGDCANISVEQLLYMKECLIKSGTAKESVIRIDNTINLVTNYNKRLKMN